MLNMINVLHFVFYFLPHYIPSPPAWSSALQIGPFKIHVYAVVILIGIAIAVYYGDKRFTLRGAEKETVLDVAIYTIPISVIGARLYHTISNWDEYYPPNGDFLAVFRIWEGGIAIFGGMLTGILVVYIYLVRIRNMRLGPFADSIAPYIPLAQVFGRIGNYFNQELFGYPTTLPWGLKLDNAHNPTEFPKGTLYHPTFLYEQILNFIVFIVLLRIDKKRTLYSGQLFSLYMIFYGIIRFLLEFIRIDPAYVFMGIRFNGWAALIVAIIGCVAFIYCGKIGKPTVYSDEEKLNWKKMSKKSEQEK